ncbi:MAG TPA: nicotinamide riboside transporter PnuC [Ktedonobacterales bacterium]|nr:nicotinamide riboside transporter PnuC [Ktedonobacterales bacterium]
MKKVLGYSLSVLISLALILASWFNLAPMSEIEVFGFISGALSVWLTVKVNIWNWPVGIANSAFYVVVFFTSQLYADMALQIVYIVLGFLGWYWWLHGGNNRTELPIEHVTLRLSAVLLVLLALGTWGETVFLQGIQDSAPFWDALTTAMSLVAQFLLTKKLIENWYVWISVDVIYIGLYIYKHLYLTSVLYALFLAMCVTGLLHWRATMRQQAALPEAVPAGGLVNG